MYIIMLPVQIKQGDRRLLLTMTAESLVGLDPDSGKYLWRAKHITVYNVHANTPLFHKGNIYIVSGYGTGGQMFQLAEDGNSVKQIWSQKNLDSQMGAVLLADGYIYGSGHNRRGWTCLDWQTGTVKFTARQIGNKGNIIFSDGLLYCYSERGDVAQVKPNPEKFEVISSFRIKEGTGPHWAHPVIKNGRLYVRHGDAMMVYQIGR